MLCDPNLSYYRTFEEILSFSWSYFIHFHFQSDIVVLLDKALHGLCEKKI